MTLKCKECYRTICLLRHKHAIFIVVTHHQILGVITSRRMLWKIHAARIGKERDYLEHLGVGGRIILKFILNKLMGGFGLV